MKKEKIVSSLFFSFLVAIICANSSAAQSTSNPKTSVENRASNSSENSQANIAKTALRIYLIFVVPILSLVTFSIYGYDKWMSNSSSNRIPEKTLHTFDVFGGWPGAILGQQLFRHKTRKTSFRLVFYVTILLNAAGVGFVVYQLYLAP